MYKRENNIKMYLRILGWEDMGWILVAYICEQGKESLVSIIREISSLSEELSDSQGRLWSVELGRNSIVRAICGY